MAVKDIADQIRQIAVEYAVMYVGDRAVEGVPSFDEQRHVWRVPILCRTSRGILLAGEMQIDEQLHIVYAPTKEELTKAVEAQLERLPYLVYATREELEAAGFEPVTLK